VLAPALLGARGGAAGRWRADAPLLLRARRQRRAAAGDRARARRPGSATAAHRHPRGARLARRSLEPRLLSRLTRANEAGARGHVGGRGGRGGDPDRRRRARADGRSPARPQRARGARAPTRGADPARASVPLDPAAHLRRGEGPGGGGAGVRRGARDRARRELTPLRSGGPRDRARARALRAAGGRAARAVAPRASQGPAGALAPRMIGYRSPRWVRSRARWWRRWRAARRPGRTLGCRWR